MQCIIELLVAILLEGFLGTRRIDLVGTNICFKPLSQLFYTETYRLYFTDAVKIGYYEH